MHRLGPRGGLYGGGCACQGNNAGRIHAIQAGHAGGPLAGTGYADCEGSLCAGCSMVEESADATANLGVE